MVLFEMRKQHDSANSRLSSWKSRRLKSFINPARTDELVLRHWKQVMPAIPIENLSDQDTAEIQVDEEDSVEQGYFFAKYNTELPGPQYTKNEYDTHLQSAEWTKEETDYLVNMVREYYHRWAVVADRYEYADGQQQGAETGATTSTERKSRSMEDLKARYYHIWAKSMEIRTPGGIAYMNPAEFHQHEILTKYDANHERRRKHLAEGLLARDPELVKEENLLLAELQRINMQHNRLEAERADLRARLEAPQSTAPSAPLQSSAVLNQLYQQLFQAERTRKRGRLSVTTGDALASPINHGVHQSSTPGSAATGAGGGTSHRDSIGAGGAGAGSHRKPSGVAGPTSASAAPVRSLSSTQEARYGVSTPLDQRLSSGVQFRSDRIAKMRQGKSLAQTQKLSAALGALRIPDLIALPTAKVCEAFERLVGRVTILNDMRRVVEKLEGEVRVAEAMKKQQDGSLQSDGNDDNAKDNDNVDESKRDSEEGKEDKVTNDTGPGSDTTLNAGSTQSRKEDGPEGEREDKIEGTAQNDIGDSKAMSALPAVEKKSSHLSAQQEQKKNEEQRTIGSKALKSTATSTSTPGGAPAVPETTEPAATAAAGADPMPTLATATSTTIASPRPGSRSSGRGHKRSASVMSTASSNTTGVGAGAGSKRTRR